MSVSKMTRDELARRLGYVDTGGAPLIGAIADAQRAALARWGLSPRRAVLEYSRAQLRACNVDDSAKLTNRALSALISMGECDEVTVIGDDYLAPAAPRWIQVGDGVAAYLSVTGPPPELERLPRGPREVARRLRVIDTEHAARLAARGAREVSLEQWLSPHSYLTHAARRLRAPVRADKMTLRDFWELLTSRLRRDGGLISNDATLRVLAGAPGEFFGKHDALSAEGRWVTTPGDGRWCAFRSGYSDAHWHPCLLEVDGDARRVLDLYDQDEWRWAVIACGRHSGLDERLTSSQGVISATTPLPRQLATALDLIGARTSPWSWSAPPGARDPLALIR